LAKRKIAKGMNDFMLRRVGVSSRSLFENTGPALPWRNCSYRPLGHAVLREAGTLLQTWDEWGSVRGLFESSIQDSPGGSEKNK
jgi:hypothetical protein